MSRGAMQMYAMADEALSRARRWKPTSSEAKRISAARRAFQGLTSSSPVGAAFNSIRGLLPFAAGMIDVLSGSRPNEPAHLIYDVPERFLEARALLINSDPAIPLAITLPAGLALRGTDAMPNGAFQRDPYNQSMYTPFGFDNVTGMILSANGSRSTQQVVVLWLFSGSGARLPTWEECRLLEHVCGDLQKAMERIKLPFIPHQQVLFQILSEQDLGYVLLRADGALREVNQRAVLLSQKYGAGGPGSWRGRIEELTSGLRASARRGAHAKQRVRCHDGSGVLEMNLHTLAKEHYDIGEDGLLIEMREISSSRTAAAGGGGGPLAALPPRQGQIAALLVESGLSYKQIADRLGRSVGTVRTHAERIYKTLRVHSRAELVELVRRYTP